MMNHFHRYQVPIKLAPLLKKTLTDLTKLCKHANVEPNLCCVFLFEFYLSTNVLQLLARLREEISGNNGITVL